LGAILSATVRHCAEVEKVTERIVREKERREITGVARTTAWELERRGDFPRRVELTGGRVGWRLTELQKWVKSRQPAASSGGAAA
jgi:prophage regulatory protein